MKVNRPRNIIVVSGPRSGSTLLVNLLNTHSHYNFEGELFNPTYFKSPIKRLLKPLIMRFPEKYVAFRALLLPGSFRKGIGFKVFNYQVNDLRQFVRRFHRKGYQVILLERKNILKKAFSQYIATEKNIWVVRSEEQQIKSVFTIDPLDLTRIIDSIRLDIHTQHWAVKGLNPIYIEYENELISPEKQAAFSLRICNELNINQEVLSTGTIVSDKRNDADRISNFYELIEYLKANGYENEVNEYMDWQSK